MELRDDNFLEIMESVENHGEVGNCLGSDRESAADAVGDGEERSAD